jgi:hypothetical protein
MVGTHIEGDGGMQAVAHLTKAVLRPSKAVGTRIQGAGVCTVLCMRTSAYVRYTSAYYLLFFSYLLVGGSSMHP